MGLLTRSLGIRAVSLEDPSQPLVPPSALFESLGLGRSDAGVLINEKQAMRLTTAYGAINVISQDLSSLPLSVLQHMPDGSVREAAEHWTYETLHAEPNEAMSSTMFRSALIACALAWGNGYALIKRDRAARLSSLHLLAPEKTSPVRIKGKIAYATTQTDDGMPAYLDAVNVLHLHGSVSFDGITSLSPISTCRNAFGLAIAAEKFGAQFFGNGARATGVLSHPAQLEAEAYERLKKSVWEWANGETALRPVVLEEGMKWDQITIPPDDAQFLQTRQFQRSEIAALYRVPLHLLQDLSRSTNNNIEHQSLDYVRYCLRPLAIRLEQEINRKLLSGAFFAEHDMNDLSRGDFASQTAGYQSLRNIGVYSANDIRRELRKNPVPTEQGGDVLTVQTAMTSLDKLMKEPTAPPAAPPAPPPGAQKPAKVPPGDANSLVHAYRRLFRDAAGRIVNREQRDEQFAYKALQPIFASLAEAVLGAEGLRASEEALVAQMARRVAGESRGWTKDYTPDIVTALASDAYTALSTALLGRTHESN
jgi:HK97 family phage portal protein